MFTSSKTYTSSPTNNDRVTTFMRICKGEVQSFAVQHETKIGDGWVKVTRIDTSHGKPHQHKFNPSGSAFTTDFFCNDYNEGLTRAQRYIKENLSKLRDNYLLQATKTRRL